MKSTVAKTYRMPEGIHQHIVAEAETLKTSEADVVRLALRHYFDKRQQLDEAAESEARILSRIDSQSERIALLIREILKLAQG